ncbi:MAG: outer membrane beta-barrel protein [Proteiniphilum sp.]|jgi:hypothetical protein|nr:outer membrane beta-barrel protein [Proteiniphilum sp.]
MKKSLLLLILFSLLSLSKLTAQFEGTFGMGVHAGYGAEIKSPGAGIHIHYYQTNNLRFAPSLTWFLERKGEGMWMVDGDAHYMLPLSFSTSLYPIAGVHYSNWSYDNWIDPDRLYDPLQGGGLSGEERTFHRLGLNLGLGFQYDISYRVRANFELKYQFMNDYSQLQFMAGYGFWF